MTDDRFDDLMRDAAHTYRRPPEPPLDEMWQAIENSVFQGTANVVALSGPRPFVESERPERPRFWNRRWLQIAATLVLGVGIGRVSMFAGRGGSHSVSPPLASGPAAPEPGRRPRGDSLPPQLATNRYLGQAAALLIALPSEMRAGRADDQFIARAGDLLLTTRLLLDSPAASDPSMRNLLEDLELVLAQVVHLQNERGRSEMDLINQALEQREVLPRLRSAVADLSAD
jgi:hypothetical protein